VVAPGASPHGYALRPSQASDLDRADAVFIVGHALTPWLEGPLEHLASDAVVVELMESEGSVVHMFREDAVFEPHDESAHDEDGPSDHDGHAHDGADPHAWLDPENGRAWLLVIAEELAALDPENAETYRSNATAGRTELADLSTGIAADLAPLSGRPFIAFHDAFQYFETRFSLSGVGAISVSDASAPSAARIAQIRDAVADFSVTCIFSEPQFNPDLVETVLAGTGAHTAVIDPLGTDLPLGPSLYPDLLRGVARTVSDCL